MTRRCKLEFKFDVIVTSLMRGLGHPTACAKPQSPYNMPVLEKRWSPKMCKDDVLECPEITISAELPVLREEFERMTTSMSSPLLTLEDIECECLILNPCNDEAIVGSRELAFELQPLDMGFSPRPVEETTGVLQNPLLFDEIERNVIPEIGHCECQIGPGASLTWKLSAGEEVFHVPDFQVKPATESVATVPESAQRDEASEKDAAEAPSVARSKLFPKILMVVPGDPVVDPQAVAKYRDNPVVICEPRLARRPEFAEMFADCRVVLRKLKYVDLELNERTGVLVENFKLDTLISAMCCFETVYLVNISGQIAASFSSHPSIRVRNFTSSREAFSFLRALASPAASHYIRNKESLHEHVLSLFPMISRTLALHMLSEGDPIKDASALLDPYPTMNASLFKLLLDMPTMSFNAHRFSRRETSKNKTQARQKRPKETYTFVPGVTKVSAPWP